MAIKDFNCNIHENYLTAEFMAANASLFPLAFYKAKEMAQLAMLLADKVDSPITFLPFDYMVEAEALGAKVKSTNDEAGLRSAGHLFDDIKNLAKLPNINFESGRIKEVLEAIALTEKAGYMPCLNISGFLGITDCLISINEVFMNWKQEKPLLNSFFNRLSADLLQYAALAQSKGAKIFSYADPLAAISLVGPKMAAEISANYVLPLLKGLLDMPGGGVIYLCGKASFALEEAGAIKTEIISLQGDVLHTKALTEIAETSHEKIIIGYGCINKRQEVNKLIKIDLI